MSNGCVLVDPGSPSADGDTNTVLVDPGSPSADGDTNTVLVDPGSPSADGDTNTVLVDPGSPSAADNVDTQHKDNITDACDVWLQVNSADITVHYSPCTESSVENTQQVMVDLCRICQDTEDPFWIGCENTSCNYWVHNTCIGIFPKAKKTSTFLKSFTYKCNGPLHK